MAATDTTDEAGPDSPDVATFRERARAWIATNLPRSEGSDGLEVDDETSHALVVQSRELQRRIFDAGFAGIRYPKRYGGQGLSRAHQVAWAEAGAGYQLPNTFNVTHGILGPTILDFGTEEQKDRHLPAMLRGKELWVQFLSEPSSGSDLAGLLTRAVRDGDTYVVNGSKIWSTGAHHSEYALMLARTNSDLPKHQGLSVFIIPIRQPGLTVSPIRLSSGAAHFCQEYFDDLSVPVANLVGPENDGWRVVTRLLFHERNMVGGNSLNDHITLSTGQEDGPDELVTLARELGLEDDPHARQLVGEALALRAIVPPTIDRVNAELRTGDLPGPGAAILKLVNSTVTLRRQRLAVELAGTCGMAWAAGDAAESVGLRWLTARIATIAGGTSEIQLNQVSERVLGLPREASPDKGLPFRDVLALRRPPRTM